MSVTALPGKGAYLIAYGGQAPAEPGDNTTFHQSLIDDMTAEATRLGWPGAAFADYGRSGGYVSLSIVPGVARPTLEDLRAFREEQRLAQAEQAEVFQPDGQGRLV